MRSLLVCICAVGLSSAHPADAASLVPQSLNLPALRYGAHAWAPLDTFGTTSGRSILALSGQTPTGELKTYIAHIGPNLSGQPSIVGAIDGTSIPGMVFGQLDWADYDQDGDLDLAIAGRINAVSGSSASAIIKVYRQLSDGTFQPLPSSDFPVVAGLDSAIVRWVDYDVDGDPDLFVSGRQSNGASARYVFRNVATGLTRQFVLDDGLESNVDQIPAIHGGDVDWADMNGDGTPDLVLAGRHVYPIQGNRFQADTVAGVYINDPPGVLRIDALANLPARCGGGVAWGDFNRDGLLDIAISGRARAADGGALALKVYENVSEGNFREALIQLEQQHAVAGRLVWADANNDGWVDLVSIGAAAAGTGGIRYYRNQQDGTLDILALVAGPAPLVDGAFILGHLDGDGTLDLIASGRNASSGTTETYAWIMSGMPANPVPEQLLLNHPTVTGDRVIFSWAKAPGSHADTTLTYELLMYTGTGLNSRVITTRAAYAPGPAGSRLAFRLNRSLLPNPGMPLYVRAVDASFHTSPWSQPVTVLVQDFVSSLETVVPVNRSAATWVDVDGDGTPDLAVNGLDQAGNEANRLYLNDRGELVPNREYDAMPELYFGGQAWGDVDGDGLADVMLSGNRSESSRITRLFLNRSDEAPGRFSTSAFSFEGMTGSRAAMGDIDNDGDMDVLVSGLTNSQGLKTILALNNGGRGAALSFTTVELKLRPTDQDQGVRDGWVSLYDFDQDGDLDITLQGNDMAGNAILEMYRNDGDVRFTLVHGWTGPSLPLNAPLPTGDARLDKLSFGEHAWADVDGDGDPDFICVGWSDVTTEFTVISPALDASALRVYENTGGGNLALTQSFPGLWLASLVVADLDDDGDVDILVSGFDDHYNGPIGQNDPDWPGLPTLRLYKNTGGTFAPEPILLFRENGSGAGIVRAADIDGDTDLDLLVAGTGLNPHNALQTQSELLTNTNAAILVDHRSSPPTGLQATEDTTNAIHLAWDEASDPDGYVHHHTYTLRVGTRPGIGDVRPGIEPVGPGSLGQVRTAWLQKLPDGAYYWSVQAVDNGWLRSDWAPEEMFTIDTTPPQVARVLGDTLGVGNDRLVNVTIDFDDALTGVDTLSPNMEVALQLPGRSALAVSHLRWGPGDVWFGQAEVDPSAFLSEPVTLTVRKVRDHRGNIMVDTTITTRLFFNAATQITPARGGMVTNSANSISLYIPPHGVDREVGLFLNDPAVASLPAGPGGARPTAGMTIEIASDVALAKFSAPAILTMHGEEATLERMTAQARTTAQARMTAQADATTDLHLFRLNDARAEWTYIGGLAQGTTISAPISHVGTYAIFASEEDVAVETLSDLTCTPRVFSPDTPEGYSSHTVISFTVATADAGDRATVMVYNTAGRLVREFTSDIAAGANSITWDGYDQGGAVVPSGLYVVAVKIAREAGDIQETKGVVVLNKYARRLDR